MLEQLPHEIFTIIVDYTALKTLQEWKRHLMNGALQAKCVHDVVYTFAQLNPYFKKLTGLSAKLEHINEVVARLVGMHCITERSAWRILRKIPRHCCIGQCQECKMQITLYEDSEDYAWDCERCKGLWHAACWMDCNPESEDYAGGQAICRECLDPCLDYVCVD